MPQVKFLQSRIDFVKSNLLNTSDDGRYVDRLPLKEEAFKNLQFDLSDSYRTAVNVSLSVERKLEMNPSFKDAYIQFMDDYEKLGYMEELDPLQQIDTFGRYSIPHYGVLQGSKKLRTVFNGSSRIKKVFLNDLLYTGSNLSPKLIDFISKWGKYRYVFVTDVEKMFRQVWFDPRDRHFLTILWRKSPFLEILAFSLKIITYGLKCSPYLAIRTLIQLAKDCGHLFLLAAPIILEESHIDNFMSGAHEIEEALEKQRQLIEILKVDGFSLRKSIVQQLF